MATRFRLSILSAVAVLIVSGMWSAAPACCPAPPSGQQVLNADQTILMIWDADKKMQHFIRQASFASEAKDFGFLVPTPAQPELQEAGNEVFPLLAQLTEPERKFVKAPSEFSCGCASKSMVPTDANVRVLEEKLVAGFQATVLEADSADELVNWLNEHGYAFSPEVQAWAAPYVEAGWKITALKVASQDESEDESEAGQRVDATALRMSFATDQPLFPYREPDPQQFVDKLNVTSRLLRIYFVGDARYQGRFSDNQMWNSYVAWSNPLNEFARGQLLELLQMPQDTGPAEWWLTEFEHDWPYGVAPSDVYFSKSKDQSTVKRPPIVEYVSSPLPSDATVYILVALVAAMPLFRGRRKESRRSS